MESGRPRTELICFSALCAVAMAVGWPRQPSARPQMLENASFIPEKHAAADVEISPSSTPEALSPDDTSTAAAGDQLASSSASPEDIAGPISADEIEKIRGLLKEDGDTAKYKGMTLVRHTALVQIGSREEKQLSEEWRKGLEQLVTGELGLSRTVASDIISARNEAFRDYYAGTLPFVEEVQATFGKDVTVALEGDWERKFNEAKARYRERVKELLGEEGTERFEELRLKYWAYFAKQAEHIPPGLE